MTQKCENNLDISPLHQFIYHFHTDFTILRLVYPFPRPLKKEKKRKNKTRTCITIVFHFSWTTTREKLKKMVMFFFLFFFFWGGGGRDKQGTFWSVGKWWTDIFTQSHFCSHGCLIRKCNWLRLLWLANVTTLVYYLPFAHLQTFGRQGRCIIGDVGTANYDFHCKASITVLLLFLGLYTGTWYRA